MGRQLLVVVAMPLAPAFEQQRRWISVISRPGLHTDTLFSKTGRGEEEGKEKINKDGREEEESRKNYHEMAIYHSFLANATHP